MGDHAPRVDSVTAKNAVVANRIGQLSVIAREQGKIHYWNAPPPSDYFTGRENELTQIDSAFNAGENTALCQALHGGGGYGKTEVAMAYAWRYGERFASVVWLNAETPEKLDASLVALFHAVHPEAGLVQEQEVQLRVARNWLASPTNLLQSDLPVLVILDNVEHPTAVLRELALGPGTRVLATTRRTDPGPVFRRVPIELLPMDAAKLLLLRRAGHIGLTSPLQEASVEEAAFAESAAETLGRLALALDQVGAMFAGQSLANFELWWRGNRESVLQTYGGPAHGMHESVWLTVIGAREALRRESEAAAQLMSACAWLDPDTIPLELFVLCQEGWPDPLREAVSDPFAAFTLAQLAASKSMIELRADTIPVRWPETRQEIEKLHPTAMLSIHRLTQEVLRAIGAKNGLEPSAATTIGALAGGFPPQDFRYWALHERLLPCWLATNRLNVASRAAAALANRLGYYLDDRSAIDAAIDAYQKAETIYRSSGDVGLGAVLNNLAHSLRATGDLDGALSSYQEAERIDRAAYGDDHPSVAIRVNNVGYVLQAKGDLDGALARFQEAERIDRAAYGDEHPSVARDVNNLGGVLQARGDLDGALDRYQEAERIDRAAYGDEHPSVAALVNNVGSVLQAKGDLDGALSRYQEAERIDRAACGDEHPSVAIRVNNVGGVLQAKGDLDGALARFQEAERIDRAAYGDEHPSVARDVNNLGGVLQARGDLDGALDRYQEAERIDRAAYGDEHPSVARDVNNVGGVLQAKGDLNGARSHYERALLIILRCFGPAGENVPGLAGNLLVIGADPIGLAAERFGPEVAARLKEAVLREYPGRVVEREGRLVLTGQ